MKPFSRRAPGFTLIEVLAALVIVAIGMMAVIQAVSQTAGNAAYLRHKTVAHWVAMNRLTEMRLLPYEQLAVGESTGEVAMANERWRWKAAITPTAVATMRRIDVSVNSLVDENDNNQLAIVSGFVGEKIGRPGSAAGWWDLLPSSVQGGKGQQRPPGSGAGS